jgi:hypothetical protein
VAGRILEAYGMALLRDTGVKLLPDCFQRSPETLEILQRAVHQVDQIHAAIWTRLLHV